MLQFCVFDSVPFFSSITTIFVFWRIETTTTTMLFLASLNLALLGAREAASANSFLHAFPRQCVTLALLACIALRRRRVGCIGRVHTKNTRHVRHSTEQLLATRDVCVQFGRSCRCIYFTRRTTDERQIIIKKTDTHAKHVSTQQVKRVCSARGAAHTFFIGRHIIVV